jgi:hypothetical protein
MKAELDKQLCEKYPKIFRDRNADMRTTAMCWGFEHGSGWYWLINQLCNHIQSYIDLNPHLKIPQVVATQVKEKYGGLRFYYKGGDKHIAGAVSLAEHLSYSICEECGSTHNVTQTKGWVYTMCEECMKNINK